MVSAVSLSLTIMSVTNPAFRAGLEQLFSSGLREQSHWLVLRTPDADSHVGGGVFFTVFAVRLVHCCFCPA